MKKSRLIIEQGDRGSWDTCPICRHIPKISYEFRRDGELVGEPLPADIARLKPIPGSRWLKCPVCGTCYDRTETYNWYTTGGEEDIYVERLFDAPKP